MASQDFPIDILDFLKRAALGEGRIVSSGDLTTLQIAEAQAVPGRFYVDPATSLGWAILPWHLRCPKDKEREDARITIPPASSPSSKQEDDREWRSRCGEAMNRVLWKHRKHVQDSPGVGKKAQDYALATIDDLADDLHRMLADFTTELPDSNPPAKSEDKGTKSADADCVCGHMVEHHYDNQGNNELGACGMHGCGCHEFRPTPTKPTESVQSEPIKDLVEQARQISKPQSVQPWPEDMTPLFDRTIRTRHKEIGAIQEGVLLSRNGVMLEVRMPNGTIASWNTTCRDLLSVSPPLESKPKSKEPRVIPPGAPSWIPFCRHNGCRVAVLNDGDYCTQHLPKPQSENPLKQVIENDKRQSVQSEGRDVCATCSHPRYQHKGYPQSGATACSLHECPCCEFRPTQPKDSKEMGPEWLPEGIEPASANFPCLWNSLGKNEVDRRDRIWRSALKSANERADLNDRSYKDMQIKCRAERERAEAAEKIADQWRQLGLYFRMTYASEASGNIVTRVNAALAQDQQTGTK